MDDGPAATPDGRWERLWTPHRMAYIKGENKPEVTGECPFCRTAPASDDGQHGPDGSDDLVVARGTACYVVLNLYPYNPGHLMVVPYRHVADLTDLNDHELQELGSLTRRAVAALRSISQPQGFNVGINLGAVAGAGIAAHLHQHVVPRWGGDTNFMPVVAGTRVLPQLLEDTRRLLSEVWDADA